MSEFFSRKSKKAVPGPHMTFCSHIWEKKGAGNAYLRTLHSVGEKNIKRNAKAEDRIPLQKHS